MSDKPRPELPADYAPAIGELVIAIGRLDSVLVDLMRIFSKTTLIVAVTSYSHLQTSSKIDTLLALYHLGSSDDEIKLGDGFTKMMSKARGLCDFRNSVVHCLWSVDEDGTAHAARFSARGKLVRTRVPVSASEIRKKAGEVYALEERLRGLRDHLNAQAIQTSEALEV